MLTARLRGLVAVAAFASSYAFRRHTPVFAGTPGARGTLRWPTLLARPLSAVESLVRISTGLSMAVRVGLRVRRAPRLQPRHELLRPLVELTPVCTLVSDTHLTAQGCAPRELDVDPGQWPFRQRLTPASLAAGVGRVLAHIHDHAPRTVIWCGDEVDTGHPDEWAQFRRVLAGTSGLAHRLIPGNHDICFNAPFDEDHSLKARGARERAFQDHGPRLADFPVVDTVASDAGLVTVLLLDSCKHPSRHVLSNAIGRFGAVQLAEVERILARVTGPVLCVTHHHVWRSRRSLSPDEWFNTAVDADDLARILLAYRRRGQGNRVLVCHGHRHTMTTGQIVDGDAAIDVIGMPSTTLGHKAGGVLDGELRYAVAGLQADGTWGLALVPVGQIVTAPREAVRRAPFVIPARDVAALSPTVPASSPGGRWREI